jgi:hypothetical protein
MQVAVLGVNEWRRKKEPIDKTDKYAQIDKFSCFHYGLKKYSLPI